ncbi:hypothetical protein [uncultured Rhodoferax sp.]|uniref:hypothetical protein n=1 Tax=uncultured Rhodoferax sp. TaxID=223188 RepID=UPI0025D2C0AB|nr:hypothetical protein [uncultured Rhodoferax sp.]
MTQTKSERLAELRKLAEAAKPWKTVNVVRPSSDEESGVAVIGAEMDEEFYPCVEVDCDQYYANSAPFANYLAAINEHGLELLGYIEAQSKALEAAGEALEKLACLGNGDKHGNSIGNEIAIAAINLIKEVQS